MGSKMDGHICDHIKSPCCNDTVRFKPTSYGYSIEVWCQRCGNYIFTGRIETFIALWMGKTSAVVKNKGYIPAWMDRVLKDANSILDAISQISESRETIIAKANDITDIK